jgi:hypothetical protein
VPAARSSKNERICARVSQDSGLFAHFGAGYRQSASFRSEYHEHEATMGRERAFLDRVSEQRPREEYNKNIRVQ